MQYYIFDNVRKVCISNWAIILENSLVNNVSDLQIQVQTLSDFLPQILKLHTDTTVMLNPLGRSRYTKKMLIFFLVFLCNVVRTIYEFIK